MSSRKRGDVISKPNNNFCQTHVYINVCTIQCEKENIGRKVFFMLVRFDRLARIFTRTSKN